MNGISDLGIRVNDHRPFEIGDFLCAESCSHRQKQDDLISQSVATRSDMMIESIDLGFREGLCLFPEGHYHAPTDEVTFDQLSNLMSLKPQPLAANTIRVYCQWFI